MATTSLQAAIAEVATRDPVLARLISRVGPITHRPRDPDGIHSEIWQEVAGQEYALPANRPLTLAAYETGNALRAYVVQAAVGAPLTDMPLFLEPGKAVEVPLARVYDVELP